MSSLRYRANGWDLRYRDPAGRERTERFAGGTPKRAPAAATERRAEVDLELARGLHVSREDRETLFRTVYAKWWAARQVSHSRTYSDEGRARLHVLPYWGHWRICDIRPSDIDDWIAMLSTKMKGDSVRACYGLLRGPLRRAVRDRLIIDPCVEIRLPKKPDRRKSFDDVLTAAELMAVADSVVDATPRYAGIKTNGRYRAMIVAGGWLAPRWNEILGVRRCDVNPLHAEIAFGRVVINENGGHIYEKHGSKTDDHRIVPVPALVMEELERHIATYCPDAGPRDYLFLTRTGTHPKRRNFSRDVLQKAAKRAGLGDRRVTWLTLRHTGASLMFDAGLTIFDVQQRLGHSSPVITQEVYTHLMRHRYESGKQLMNTYIQQQLSGGPATDPPREEGVVEM